MLRRAADDGVLHHVGVQVDGCLHLWRADVVAGGNDHVVRAGLVGEVPVLVFREGIAGDVPAVDHIICLPGVVQVAASSGADDREPAKLPGSEFQTLVIEDGCPVPWHCPSGGAGPDVIARGGDEDVEHFRGSDAVDEPEACGLPNCLPRFLG